MTRGNVRRPDVTVDCGDFDPDALASSEPTVFFEVLSPSTRGVDLVRKADEYRLLPGLQAFVIIEPTRADVALWARVDASGEWAEPVKMEAVTDSLPLAAIGVELPLSEIYEGVPLDG